ncbi:MAG: MBL fold metallo-hydrolase [Leptospiraceae bacterium]|nr:MBL fold metallo-hydrolase [Leptospiraceae bacterium]
MEDNTICTIDCNYVYPQIAASFLLKEGGNAVFIENNTSHSVPYLVKELENQKLTKEKVKYLIVTHVHLDHAGGTSALLKECPNAIVLAHPRTATHLVNPKRLIESAIGVYGKENFEKLYGKIDPIPENRIRIMEDGEVLDFNGRPLTFIYTKGHANHHFVIYDKKTTSIFTGDSFGLAYPGLQTGNNKFIFPSTSPTDFDPEEAILSIDKIINTGAEKAYLTHFGLWDDMEEAKNQLKRSLNTINQFYQEALRLGNDKQIDDFCKENVMAFFQKELSTRGIKLDTSSHQLLNMDIELNAQGIAFSVKRQKRKKLPNK